MKMELNLMKIFYNDIARKENTLQQPCIPSKEHLVIRELGGIKIRNGHWINHHFLLTFEMNCLEENPLYLNSTIIFFKGCESTQYHCKPY